MATWLGLSLSRIGLEWRSTGVNAICRYSCPGCSCTDWHGRSVERYRYELRKRRAVDAVHTESRQGTHTTLSLSITLDVESPRSVFTPPLRLTALKQWVFFFSSRRRHTRLQGDWSSDVCSSDLSQGSSGVHPPELPHGRLRIYSQRRSVKVTPQQLGNMKEIGWQEMTIADLVGKLAGDRKSVV